MKNSFNKNLNTFGIVILLVLVASFGIFNRYKLNPVSSYNQFNTKQEILDTIKQNYTGDLPTDEKLRETELRAVVASLDDPYSEYLTVKDTQEIKNEINRQYEGIGVSFKETDAGFVVEKVFNNSPAKEAGIQAEDLLQKVDNKSTDGMDFAEVVKLIKGPKDTLVKLEFVRGGKNLQFEVTRRSITADLVTLDFKDKYAILNITSFGEQVDTQLNDAAQKILQNKEAKEIILDLRDNTGGLLNEAVDTVSYFIEPDKVVLKEKTKTRIINHNSTKKEFSLQNYPVKILINKNTASASEIVAGSLRDHKGAQLIGQKSYGKGVVQQIFPLKNGDGMKLTIAEWITPNDIKINKTGLEPDVKLKSDVDSLQEAIKAN